MNEGLVGDEYMIEHEHIIENYHICVLISFELFGSEHRHVKFLCRTGMPGLFKIVMNMSTESHSY
jgi:hypothetical protein